MSNVCIIIPMYDYNLMTEKCIRLANENSGVKDCDILVIDNGSEKPHKPVCGEHVIRLEKNIGFTGAVNKGIDWCNNRYDYIMVLNNDTEPREGFVKHLVDAMEADKTIAIASSTRVVPANGSGSYELGGVDWMRGHAKVAWQKESEIMEFDWIPFCSVLIRNDVIKEIGRLNRHMKNYCSDNDFCLRCRMVGYRIVIVPQSEVLHYRGVTIREHHDSLCLPDDQKYFLENLTGSRLQTMLERLPLDTERKIWGRITFEVEERK